jgi:hypothetical protein
MNGTNKNKPVITRAPPPPPPTSVPKTTPPINEDLLLIDFSDIPTEKPLEKLLTNHQTPIIQTSHLSPPIPQRFSNNVTDSQQFVAKVVSGVTEQLKNDFPRLNSTTKEYTPPLVRRFTVPYPSSYYNFHRPQ